MNPRLIIGFGLIILAAFLHEMRVVRDEREFLRLDSAAVMSQDLVNALDVLRQTPANQRRTWSPAEVEARYTAAFLEADEILRKATALEHSTAYPCTIRTYYRDCFRAWGTY